MGRFSISKLPAALRKDLRELSPAIQPKGKYYRLDFGSGGCVAVCHEPEILESALSHGSIQERGDSYTECSPELDAALKSNDWEKEQNYKLLAQVVQHVANGHYNDQIVEKLRSIAEINRLHEAESILASAPSRTVCGPIESWCLSALCVYCESEFRRLDSRGDILEKYLRG